MLYIHYFTSSSQKSNEESTIIDKESETQAGKNLPNKLVSGTT